MNHRNVTCSVAMATYNGEKYILDQLRSIELQSVLPDEVIICDDNSTDSTIAILQKYIATSKLNIRLQRNPTNLGFRKNYELAISLCTKDIVFLCDQDDVWTPNKVEVFTQAFESDPDLVYAFSDAFIADSELNITADSIWVHSGIDWTALNEQSFFDLVQTRVFPLGFSAAARRTFAQALIPFPSDHDGWIALCAPAFGKIKPICEKLVFYRRHRNTTSSYAKPNEFATDQKKKLKKFYRECTTLSYQHYFIWPKCEYDNYSIVLSYATQNNPNLDCSEIYGHLRFLEAVISVEEKNYLHRIATLLRLYQEGLFAKYRGGIKRLILDCIFLIVNSYRQ